MIYTKSVVTAPLNSGKIVDVIQNKIDELTDHPRFFDIVGITTYVTKTVQYGVIWVKFLDAEEV